MQAVPQRRPKEVPGTDKSREKGYQMTKDELAATREWMPIDTAPTDGTEFDVWCVDPRFPQAVLSGVRFTGVKMRGDKSGFGHVLHLPNHTAKWQYLDARDADSIYPEWIPTHWMPTPLPPPKAAKSEITND